MAKNSKYVINAKGLNKSFGKLKVLDGVNLQVEKGTVLALLGPNGAGKTTAVRILATLLQPDSGTAVIDGYDVTSDAQAVRSLIGLTGQYAAVDEYLTGRENLKMMGRLYHLSKADTKRRTEESLEQFDLVKAADRYAKTYSGGMRRRLDLAASLIATPPILFLDEPTTGLDPRSRQAMWEIIKGLVASGTTILLTTQYLEEADQLADSIVVLDEGKVIARGTASELKGKVGREQIHFEFERKSDVLKAAEIVGNKSLEINENQNSLSVESGKGVTNLRKYLEEFEKSKIRVTGLSLSKPTLDDVFLKLTGRKVRAEKQSSTENKEEEKS